MIINSINQQQLEERKVSAIGPHLNGDVKIEKAKIPDWYENTKY